MKIDKKAVGLRIKQIRLNNGHTLKSFGELFGATTSNVQKWEIGFALPSVRRLFLISEYSNITVDELLYGNNEKDIEYIYNQIIKLSKNDATTLINKVNEYFGGE